MRLESYDAEKYPFRSLIEEALGHEDLEQLHTHYDYAPFTMETTPIRYRTITSTARFDLGGQTLSFYTTSL